jgi:hypothetical protein
MKFIVLTSGGRKQFVNPLSVELVEVYSNRVDVVLSSGVKCTMSTKNNEDAQKAADEITRQVMEFFSRNEWAV